MTATPGTYSIGYGLLSERRSWHNWLGRQLTPDVVMAAQAEVDALVQVARHLKQHEVYYERCRLRCYPTGEAADLVFQARLIAALVNANLARLPSFQNEFAPARGYRWVTVPRYDLDSL